MRSEPHLATRVIAPEGVVFEGQAIGVTSVNGTGGFSILPGHAHFITLIYEKIIVHTNKRDAKEIAIQQGVLSCRDDKVDIYIGITMKEPAAVEAHPAAEAEQEEPPAPESSPSS